MISVIGSERYSAFLKSFSNAADKRLVRARVAELLDAQVGVRALGGGRGVERRVDAVLRDVVLALELEGHQRGRAVLRELAVVALGVGRLDLFDVRRGLELRHDVVDRGGELRVAVRGLALALHEHLLAGLLREACSRDGLVGGARLAVAHVLVRQVVHTDGAADEGGEDDEEDPTEDRALAVLCAPATGAGSEVLFRHATQGRTAPGVLPGGEPASFGAVYLRWCSPPTPGPSAARRGVTLRRLLRAG